MIEFNSRFRSRIYSIHQIGPLREQPEHNPKIDIDKNITSVGYAGENIMNVLHNLSDKNLEEINNWMENLEIGYQIETTFNTEFSIQKLTLVDKNALRVSISDVGFGVTQILPIVIESVLSKGKIITIEQPELHVHPKLQSNLADLFIWSSKKQ